MSVLKDLIDNCKREMGDKIFARFAEDLRSGTVSDDCWGCGGSGRSDDNPQMICKYCGASGKRRDHLTLTQTPKGVE